MVLCAALVILFAAGIWGWIEWRSAPPPPPAIKLPEMPSH
jgi:hypothetical protein